jgi:hypothetical protein
MHCCKNVVWPNEEVFVSLLSSSQLQTNKKYPEKLNGEHAGGEEWMKLCLRKHRGAVKRKPEVNRLH